VATCTTRTQTKNKVDTRIHSATGFAEVVVLRKRFQQLTEQKTTQKRREPTNAEGMELGMGIEPQSKWRHRQINSFFAALFPFFLFVNYSSEHQKEALRKQS
jgi:hypothetical protein